MPIQHRNIAWSLALLFLAPAFCQTPEPAPDEPVAHFGTSVVITNGLRGDIYFIHRDSTHLPNFAKMKSKGAIYTNELNIPRRVFDAGFPGVTDRFEWFAIDYNGKFWIDTPGEYTWGLASDDGSKLYIDGHEVINNDGQHPTQAAAGTTKLKQGEHRIRVSYFQGPRYEVSLILAVIPPGEHEFGLFNMEDYLSPEALAEWKKSKPDDPRFSGVKPRRKPAPDFVLGPPN
jgi:hypothetical protein